MANQIRSVSAISIAFFKDEEGLTIVEYVIGAALLVAALSGVFVLFGSELANSMASTMADIPVVNND
ncbi:Flp family type IVb pilin [Vibrio breoganii]